MQTWAKRGLQTALVTGGMLMLGTGIASADEDVNPDRPASPLDGSLSVPIKLDNNAVGTPAGQADLPAVTPTVEVDSSERIASVPVAGRVADDATRKAHLGGREALRGNKASGDMVVPVDVSGNAFGAAGDVAVANDSRQHVRHTQPIRTYGGDSALAGNVVDLDYGAPVQITGNAIAAGSTASTLNSAEQSATADGDIETDGTDGTLAGNVAAGQGATPVQVNGNAIAGAGVASAASGTTSEATSGGTIVTTGEDSTLSGNGAGAPLAVPVRVSGQAIGAGGNADAMSAAASTAQAGAERPDATGVPAYLETDGSPATVAGNVAQPAAAGPVSLDCTSVAGLGNADSWCGTDTTADAGGGNRTTGYDAVLSGTAADAPVALPVAAMGNTAAGVGNTSSTQTNRVTSDAGGTSYTRGHDGVLSGSVASTPVAGPLDLCGNAAGGAGQSDITCDNTAVTEAGGTTGTTGSDAVAGGNAAVVPVAMPVASLGNTGGALGETDVDLVEHKRSTAGGDSNTHDDAALGSANLVQAPVAGPVQAFGNGAGAGANTGSAVALDNTVEAGGDSRAKGAMGTMSGNIAQAPVALPTQAFGTGASALGNGEHAATNATRSTAGGKALTDGTDGNIAGNVMSAPVSSTMHGHGSAVAAAGDSVSVADSTTGSTAGGTTTTSGRSGNLAGNVVSPQAMPIAQGFGDALSGVAGDSSGTAVSTTAGRSGGDITTDGEQGYLSGNLVDVPAAALAQPHGDAVAAVASQASGTSNNTTTGAVGGTSSTSGALGALSGVDATAPVGVDAPVYDVPDEVLADAMAEGVHLSDVTVGGQEPQLQPLPTGGLQATELPPLTKVLARPSARSAQLDPLSAVLSATAQPVAGLKEATATVLKAVTGGTLGGVTGGSARSDRNDPVSDLVDGLVGSTGLPVVTGAANGVLTGVAEGSSRSARSDDPVNDAMGNALGATGLPVGNVAGATSGLLSGVGAGSSRSDRSDPVTGLLGGLLGGGGGSPLGGVTDAAGGLLGGGGGSPLGGVTGMASNLLSGLPVGGLTRTAGEAAAAESLLAPRSDAPAVPGLEGVISGELWPSDPLGDLPVPTPALSDLDTTAVLPVAGDSLADTQSRLAGLVGHFPVR